MHEIKSPFLILMEEQSYLAQSLESAFEKRLCQTVRQLLILKNKMSK